jgi:hypothetical protein
MENSVLKIFVPLFKRHPVQKLNIFGVEIIRDIYIKIEPPTVQTAVFVGGKRTEFRPSASNICGSSVLGTFGSHTVF